MCWTNLGPDMSGRSQQCKFKFQNYQEKHRNEKQLQQKQIHEFSKQSYNELQNPKVQVKSMCDVNWSEFSWQSFAKRPNVPQLKPFWPLRTPSTSPASSSLFIFLCNHVTASVCLLWMASVATAVSLSAGPIESSIVLTFKNVSRPWSRSAPHFYRLSQLAVHLLDRVSHLALHQLHWIRHRAHHQSHCIHQLALHLSLPPSLLNPCARSASFLLLSPRSVTARLVLLPRLSLTICKRLLHAQRVQISITVPRLPCSRPSLPIISRLSRSAAGTWEPPTSPLA